MTRTRRRLLTLGGAALAAAFAGCTGGGSDATTSDATTNTDTETTEQTPPEPTPTDSPTATATESSTSTPTATESPTATQTPEPTATPVDLADGAITIADFEFSPLVASVSTGTTVEWTNEDGVAHNVVATQFNDGAASWSYRSGNIDRDGTSSYTFDSAGAYEYYCSIHGENAMCGVVLVGGADRPGPLPCE